MPEELAEMFFNGLKDKTAVQLEHRSGKMISATDLTKSGLNRFGVYLTEDVFHLNFSHFDLGESKPAFLKKAKELGLNVVFSENNSGNGYIESKFKSLDKFKSFLNAFLKKRGSE